MPVDKKTVNQFQSWLHDNVEGVIPDFPGTKVTLKSGGRATYDPETGEVKVSLNFILGDADAGAKAAFARDASHYGLDPADHGRTFKVRHDTFTVSSIEPRRRKRPIVCTKDGKPYLFQAHHVAAYLYAEGAKKVTFKDEGSSDRGMTYGPCYSLDANGEILHDFGWLNRGEAREVASISRAVFEEV